MRIAPLTEDEDARIALLSSIDILDSAPEDCFDRVTRLAARLLDTPIALVTLIDEHRQWFKSRVGLQVAETPRDLSFCAHALHREGTFVVPDATRDERFFDNPLVTGAPYIRFYAGVPLRSSEGVPLGVLCVIDQKARQLAPQDEETLQDLAALLSQELVRREMAAKARASMSFHLETDARGASPVFRYASEKLAELVGCTPRDLCRDAGLFLRGIAPEHRERLRALASRAAASNTGGSCQLRLVRAEGEPMWCEINAVPRRLPDGRIRWSGYLADVTHDRRIQERIRENDKLRLGSMLAMGVAHDFNNLLGTLRGSLELALLDAPADSRQQRHLSRALQASERAATLVRQLLDYARQTPSRPVALRLGSFLHELRPLLELALPAPVGLAIEVAQECEVAADVIQLEQVLLNLVRNAGHALRGRGAQDVELLLDALPADRSPLKCPSARLRVRDHGCGIAAEHLGDVFQPFFTTKPVGEGTGLGLAATQGIVTGHGGRIEVQSTPGVSTTFTVWLPLAAASA
ncbi:ATP-binding protein [Caldimonas tepidiphila]|uniref:ATP-binding protein n=1 Tax=Caldimonas tepidiphila TaxID=2315841 RepID=UPI000E5BCDE0|nr:ATP-binding protein [Caldimonas tepidiphila]